MMLRSIRNIFKCLYLHSKFRRIVWNKFHIKVSCFNVRCVWEKPLKVTKALTGTEVHRIIFFDEHGNIFKEEEPLPQDRYIARLDLKAGFPPILTIQYPDEECV